jgi:Saxitoxin biosynthesis operon protein SxtJ
VILDDLRSIKSGKRDLRKFGLTVGIAFAVFGGLLVWRGKPAYPYFFGLGAALILLALAAPAVLKPVHKAWMALALVLGWFMTRLLLGLLFYVGFTPIGLLARLFGKPFLGRAKDPARATYWVRRSLPGEPDPKRYERQF